MKKKEDKILTHCVCNMFELNGKVQANANRTTAQMDLSETNNHCDFFFFGWCVRFVKKVCTLKQKKYKFATVVFFVDTEERANGANVLIYLVGIFLAAHFSVLGNDFEDNGIIDIHICIYAAAVYEY